MYSKQSPHSYHIKNINEKFLLVDCGSNADQYSDNNKLSCVHFKTTDERNYLLESTGVNTASFWRMLRGLHRCNDRTVPEQTGEALCRQNTGCYLQYRGHILKAQQSIDDEPSNARFLCDTADSNCDPSLILAKIYLQNLKYTFIRSEDMNRC